MRIQARQQLLEVWGAVARYSRPDGIWIWNGRHGRNSISDAEQLLCLMGPAIDIPTFKLDRPNETAEDVLEALALLGDSVEIPRLLIKVIREYLTEYTDDSGTPLFSGGSYFTSTSKVEPEPTEAQRALDVVDSFSVSIRLTLAVVGFVRVFRGLIQREDLRREVDALEALASTRLTAAMIGLLRSFAVLVFDVSSPEGEILCRMMNHGELPFRRVEDLQNELREIKAGLRDVTVGSGQVSDLDNENKLFQCGWSWGIVKDAPIVKTTTDIGHQPNGFAFAAPYLYFTVVALDSIQNLFSERTRILGLLDEEQQRLARNLQLRWDLTQSYWSKIARFGRGRWPLEDIPWQTLDGVTTDYLTLLVSSIVVQELSVRRPADPVVHRVGQVLRELAGRARITRRPLEGDPALSLHAPGYPLPLEGSEDAGGSRLSWLLADFSPQLLKQTIRIAGLLRTVELRGDVVSLADQVWEEHLQRRRLTTGTGSQLWDQPSAVYEELQSGEARPSWYYTERVVGCLVTAADLISSPPLPSPALTDLATSLLAEADHLFDQELLTVSAEAGPAMGNALNAVRASLRRAHEIMPDRPGTAATLAQGVLRELDRLTAARHQAAGAG